MSGILSEETIEYLRLFHGSYNFTIFLLFVYQATLGWKIRRARRAGSPMPVETVKRHRKQGPVIAALGVAGYLVGLTVIYLDEGRIFKYPLHFANGSLIASLIITTYLVSLRIKAGEALRTPHFFIGVGILCLYVIQALLGLGILL